MGCCESSFQKAPSSQAKTSGDCYGRRESYHDEGGDSKKRRPLSHHNRTASDKRGWNFSSLPDFFEFSLTVLRTATNDFSADAIISTSDEDAPNIVYKGCLRRGQDVCWIAVKKFSKAAWPDPKQFDEEAWDVGRLRHKRLVNLIGYCCDGDERLLVSEYMPNNTLAKHLFHWENQTIEWATRLRVAVYVAEALEFCSQAGRPLYHDLNACRVMFDENGDPRLSCFGLMKYSRDGKSFSSNLPYIPPEYLKHGTFIPESVIFSFGIFLLDLLSGKHVPPNHALETIQRQNLPVLMDSHLEGNFPQEDAAMVFDLASKCLQTEPRDRPETRDLVFKLATLQRRVDVPSDAIVGIPKLEAPPSQQLHSPIYYACSQMDLTSLYQIIEAADYKDDDAACELSFQQWASQIKQVLEARQRGDLAFRSKDFTSAIEKYTQFLESGTMVSPTVYARRSVCYLFCDQPDAALKDAIQAQCVHPNWPTAFYLQAFCLAKLNLREDSAKMLKEASVQEDKRFKI